MSIRVVKVGGREWGVIQDSSGTFFAPVFTSEVAALIFAEHYRRSNPFDSAKARAEWEAPGQVGVAESIAEYVGTLFDSDRRALKSDSQLWSGWRTWLAEAEEKRKQQAVEAFTATGQ